MSDDLAQNSGDQRELAPRVVGRPWPKGVSGNPSGRPRSRVLTAALRERLSDPATVDAIVNGLIDAAKAGNVGAVREILDRTEGRVPPAVEPPDGDDDQSALVISLGEAALAAMEAL